MASTKSDLQSEEVSHLQSALVEAHHRVKNTLQNIISYINIMFAQRDTITKSDMKKLTRYLYALSTIHDILLEEVKVSGNGTRVRLDRVIGDLIQVSSVDEAIHCEYLPPLFSTARQAATLSLVLSELIDNATRHGEGAVTVMVEDEGNGFAEIQIQNRIANNDSPNIDKGNGLRIAEVLSKSELNSSIQITKDKDTFSVKIQFPIEEPAVL